MDRDQHLDRSADGAVAVYLDARKSMGQVDSVKVVADILRIVLNANEHTVGHRAPEFLLEKLERGDFNPGRSSDQQIVNLIKRYVGAGQQSYNLIPEIISYDSKNDLSSFCL